MKKISLLVIGAVLSLVARAQLPPMPVRPAVNPALAPFYHGVASGDPLADKVIIWTRVTPTAPAPISVNWEMATDTLFAHVVNSGTVTTDSAVDYTVKVDVTGLSANTWYYYRFKSGPAYSICGRTKTLPLGNVDSIRLAVFSCSDFQEGYFNAYNHISKRNDISAVLHLGDYYYEYKSAATGDPSRFHPLSHDASTLGDYRLWESQYRLEQDLRAMLEQYPIIMVWDDHESANNSWMAGAENHSAATQGYWLTRKNAARKAYFEWNPVRSAATGNDSIIHRNFNFGNLFNLVMLDTRLEGRDSALGSLISSSQPYMNNPSRQMLGTTQLSWFKTQLSDVATKWKIVGTQVMIAPLTFAGNVVNGDQWDGYPAEKKRVFDHISSNNIKDVVFVTGDIHSSWAADLPDPDSNYISATGAGSVGTEFVVSSVTSTANVPVPAVTIQLANPWFKYIDFAKRGYVLLDINKTRTQGDYIHLSGTDTRSYTTTNDAQWMNLDNERHLRAAPAPLGANPGNPPLVTPFPAGTTQADQSADAGLHVFTCYPNPSFNEVVLQYYLSEPSKLSITLVDMTGKVVYATTTKDVVRGLNISTVSLAGIIPGAYVVTLRSEKDAYSARIIKN